MKAAVYLKTDRNSQIGSFDYANKEFVLFKGCKISQTNRALGKTDPRIIERRNNLLNNVKNGKLEQDYKGDSPNDIAEALTGGTQSANTFFCLRIPYYDGYLSHKECEDIYNETEIDEINNFKQLLNWFINQIKINNGIILGERHQGKGCQNEGILNYYKKWRLFNGFSLNCTISTFRKNSGSNFIHYHKININPNLDQNNDVISVFIKDANSGKKLSSDIKVSDLGLQDNMPNDTLKNLWQKYKEYILNKKQQLINSQTGEKQNAKIANENEGATTRKDNDELVWQQLEYCEKDDNGNIVKKHVFPHNRIIFGAPGTGKSNLLKTETEETLKGQIAEVVRVTFHPDYSYAHFVGTYKPVMEKTSDGKEEIKYKFIPGPFLNVYKKARKNPAENYVLIIEEINRANVAAVFGDVFQLLDRDNGISEYPIDLSEDIRKHFKDEKAENNFPETDEVTEEIDGKSRTINLLEKMSLPKNMYIWATMNSADQGVYPMDTAFKRRWTFEYMDIDQGKDSVKDWKISLPSNKTCEWNKLRKAINDKLIAERVNEDKCLGPHFIKEEDGEDMEKFASKVLMYLFEDVVKQNPLKIFNLAKNEMIFSKVREKFIKNGLDVFNFTKEEKEKILGEDANSVSDGEKKGTQELSDSNVPKNLDETSQEETA